MKKNGSHLDLVARCFEERKEVDAAAAMEHPDAAESWKPKPVEEMKGYLEGVVGPCRKMVSSICQERPGDLKGADLNKAKNDMEDFGRGYGSSVQLKRTSCADDWKIHGPERHAEL